MDWSIIVIAFVNGVAMLLSMQLILVVFGIFGSYFAMKDAKLFYDIVNKKELQKNTWIIRHIGMMLGGYIATFTAFLVVNVSLESLPWLPWLLPTIIGTPLIAYWTRKYQLKKSK
jgi:ABC-type enterochelin transport system permease subunit